MKDLKESVKEGSKKPENEQIREKDHAKDYTKEHSKDHTNEYSKDYGKEASKDKKNTQNQYSSYNPFQPSTVKSAKTNTKVRITCKDSCSNVKLFNMAEIDAPGGFTLTLTLPFPMPESTLKKFAESIKPAGGEIEIEE